MNTEDERLLFWMFVIAIALFGIPFLIENFYYRRRSCRTWRGGHNFKNERGQWQVEKLIETIGPDREDAIEVGYYVLICRKCGAGKPPF